jgi:hypothetical protein
MAGDVLRIGNAGGYWGDDLTALRRQIEGGPIDVVTLDFLAEITMSILQKQRARDPQAGYARDFVDQMREVMREAVARGVTIITNAGGVNPDGCAQALVRLAVELKLEASVGLVAGDDILGRIEAWTKEGVRLDNMDDGRPFAAIAGRVTSANAYFGAAPVVEALQLGARFVVTGRVTDTGITLAPMIHRFGWKPTDYDQLAAGIIAGHILECGAQSTGGNLTDWERVPAFHNIGYPIAEVSPDGSFVITKHKGSGGLVSAQTIKEQLVYEMGDPRAYITPDVVADFSSVRLESLGRDRVRVWGIRGAPPTRFLKVSMSYADGYKASGAVIVCGPQARAKSEVFAEILWKRLPHYEEQLTEYVGADATWGPLSPGREANEIYLRFGARDHDREKLRAFSKTLPALILSGPPGVAVTGGRPEIQDVVAYWPALIPRERCQAAVVVLCGERREEALVAFEGPTGSGTVEGPSVHELMQPGQHPPRPTGHTVAVPLSRLAYGRSGDKGDTCNIGVIARHPLLYLWLRDALTADVVKARFTGLVQGKVERFEVHNLSALNFLLHGCLGGGGTLSLRIDPQGKTLSHALLAMEVEVDEAWLKLADSTDEVAGGGRY